MTEAYEKLHATVTFWVLHRATDHFRFVVPEGFEITESTPRLWPAGTSKSEPARKVVNVRLREQTSDTVVLSIAAVKTPARLQQWHMPRLDLLDVVGQVTVLGLLVQEDLKTESLARRRPDRGRYGRAGHGPAGDPAACRAGRRSLAAYIAAYYAPQGGYDLSGRFHPLARDPCRDDEPAAEHSGQRLQVQGGFALFPDGREALQFRLQRAARLDGERGHWTGQEALEH